jgi:Tfp pilus assembly protein PilZ
MIDNKRKSKRLNCIVPVEGKEGSIFDQLKTVDFGKGGLGFISQYRIPINKEIAIEIDLKEEEAPVFVIGKVKWIYPLINSNNFRIGVSFENIYKGSKSRLNKYFRKSNEFTES